LPQSAATPNRPPVSRSTSELLARATPAESLGIVSASSHRSDRAQSERPRPLTGGQRRARKAALPVPERSIEATSDRLEPATSELCSDRESVLEGAPLGAQPSRCSHDLFPLRGNPIQPLGFRPPLMCLLHLLPPCPKALWLPALRHFRVSIRLGLEAAPETGSNLHGVCNLFRSPKTLQPSRANP
jgi:hypothetical protein